MKLFTVGPVACRPEILEEMGKQMFSHRSERYRDLHREIIDRLQNFLETEKRIFLFPSSGSGVMESSVRNCAEEKILCCVSGAFGERYVEVAESNGLTVETLETELGDPVLPEKLDEELTNNPDVEAVSITFSETSVGLLNPLPELAKVVNFHDKLLFVDAVSAMGGTDIKVDEWGIDICFASSQKCFGVPPGLAVASVSDEAMEKSGQIEDRGWYFDLELYEEYDERKDGTHMTPSIPQILALNKRLELIEEDGKDEHFKGYLDRSRRIREGVRNLGLTPFPEEGYESPTVTCVNAPEGRSGTEIYRKMRKRGFELAKGYGELSEDTFRIGNMGHIPPDNIEQMLKSLGEIVQE